MTTATAAPALAQSELSRDLTACTLAQLVDSADEVLGYPDEPGAIALAEDCGIAWTMHGVAVVDVPGFLEMWGAPVTHARAAAVKKAIRDRSIAPLLPAMTAEDCRREIGRAEDRAELTAEHGGSCDCANCWNLNAIVDVGDLPFHAMVAELSDGDRKQAEEAANRG